MKTKRIVPSELVGNAGEFFVLGELTRRGWTAALTARNNRGYDILAKKGDEFAAIRVKTKTSISTVFQWNAKSTGDIFLEMSRSRDFCILVEIPADDVGPAYFVVPTKIIDRWLRKDFTEWVTTPGAKGQQRARDNPRRLFYVDTQAGKLGHGYLHKLGQYKGAWNLLESES
ncbi:MAG: hypothetical protein ACRD5I_00120 [Candidatus Acidiferrales bacterium]